MRSNVRLSTHLEELVHHFGLRFEDLCSLVHGYNALIVVHVLAYYARGGRRAWRVHGSRHAIFDLEYGIYSSRVQSGSIIPSSRSPGSMHGSRSPRSNVHPPRGRPGSSRASGPSPQLDPTDLCPDLDPPDPMYTHLVDVLGQAVRQGPTGPFQPYPQPRPTPQVQPLGAGCRGRLSAVSGGPGRRAGEGVPHSADHHLS